MADDFKYDVFLSHSTKDKPAVREIAQRLKGDGLRVWFDEWVLKPGDSIPAKIEHGLEHSRVLILCMSANAFGSEWSQLESYTFRFRDPLNQERRFIPLRLDTEPIKGSLAQFLYVNWHMGTRDAEYAKLLDACRHSPTSNEGIGKSEPYTIEAGSLSTALPFLQQKIESEFERLNREKITPWASFNSHGVSIEGPDGRIWRYAGVAFVGSPRDVFWNDFLHPFIQDITCRMFDEVRRFCELRGLDIPSAMSDTARLLKVGLARTLNRMVQIDQRLCGNGSPDSARRLDVTDTQTNLERIIDRRRQAEAVPPTNTRTPISVQSDGQRTTPADDYLRRRRDTIERVFTAFEAIHVFFFKVCIDYSALVEVLHLGIKAPDAEQEKYFGYIKEIGQRLHEIHILEGRLRLADAKLAMRAMQQYRLQAVEVNNMLQLQRPKLTKQGVEAVADELFRRKEQLYEQLAKALKISDAK